jgi:membrane-bound lytic murein transglycosylase D
VTGLHRFAGVALGIALAACSAPQPRPAVPASPEPARVTPAKVPSPPRAAPAPPTTAEPPAPASPWERIRAQRALPGCDYRPEVLVWAKRYTANPARFAATLQQAMPFLLVALAEVERLHVPAEFALLPWVESHYRPLPGRGDRPAGMWQFVPSTARGAGLVVNRDYDGRLDAIESTRAAIGLIASYGERFGDWRLADIAFNAGEYRVRRLIGDTDTRTWPAKRFAQLRFSPTSHAHLDKLLAMSCVITEPERFDVRLPEPRERDHLDAITLDAPLDLRVAARLVGTEFDELQRWNAAYRSERMPDGVPWHLNLPKPRIAAFREAVAAIPPALRRDWQERTVREPLAVDTLAAANDLPADMLRRINGLAPDAAEIRSGTALLLPGNERPKARPASAQTYVVRAGDTLSAIARQFGVALEELLDWNRLSPTGILRPGDQLTIGDAGME